MKSPGSGFSSSTISASQVPSATYFTSLILLIEQNLDLALSVSDRFIFMEKGEIVHESTRDQITSPAEVEKYLLI
jgi:ABC-type branched-subunit amino acid transport system ATPase component